MMKTITRLLTYAVQELSLHHLASRVTTPVLLLGFLTSNLFSQLPIPDDFNPGASSYVYSVALQADGKILVGGNFTTLGGQTRNYLGRLSADGTVDTSFNPGTGSYVYSVALQPDGKILVGGSFTTLGGQTRNRIGRLNSDGTLDTSFDPGASASVCSLALQADGKILVGGYFTTLGGQTRNYLGRLNSDGTVDTRFNPGASSGVFSVALQADGKILVGGYFTTLGGQTRNRIGRLNGTKPDTQGLVYDGAAITWLRGATGPELWRADFEWSSDGVLWTPLGAGTRVTGGWQLTNAVVPLNASIRARGFAVGGYGNGSSWFVESLLLPNSDLRVTSWDTSCPGVFKMIVDGPMGGDYVLLESPNLRDWTSLSTNTPAVLPFAVMATNTPGLSKFYRWMIQHRP